MLNPETSLNRRPADRIAKSRWVAAVAGVVQPIVRDLLDAAGAPLRDALHGTWLGHPLHPVLTDVPSGAWTVAAVLDAAELAGVRVFAPGADAAIAIGLAGAFGAILTGYADWSDTADEARTLGYAHGMLAGAATLAYAGALAARRARRRRLGAGLAFAGYGALSVAAYLGGELSLGLNLGVRHTAEPIFPPAEFTPVAGVDELVSGELLRADFHGIPIVLVREAERVLALGAACTHRGAPLDGGTLEGGCVRCPWHGSRFALADGAVREGPASFPQPRFEARERAGRIEVRPLQPSVASM